MAEALRIVLAGCGGMSAAWLNTVCDLPGVEMVGLVDIRLDAALKRQEEYGLASAVTDTDLERVLKSISPDIVFDCTVPEAHTGVTLTALAHGCHVLGEKPMADSMDNARKMVSAAQQANKLYAVIQNRRYNPTARRVQHFLASNAIGRLTTVNCDFYIGAHFGGFRDRMEHVLLLDMAIHTFDAARFFTKTDPVAVYCREWNPPGSWYDHDASAIAIFEMTNDVVYTYRGSWCAEGLNTTWECDWRFVGTNGTARWDGADDFQAQVVTETGSFFSKHQNLSLPEVDTTGKVDGHAGLIREFVNAVRTGSKPETICTDNIRSLAMVFGAIESAEKDQRIAIVTQ